MHRTVLLLFILSVYYAIATAGLYTFDAGMLASTLILFGVPSMVFARFSVAPPMVLSPTTQGYGLTWVTGPPPLPLTPP